MSNTAEWLNRQSSHRYSQDPRNLSYLYSKELEKKLQEFLDGKDAHISITVDSNKEPWKEQTIKTLARTFQLKFTGENGNYVLYKQKLSAIR